MFLLLTFFLLIYDIESCQAKNCFFRLYLFSMFYMYILMLQRIKQNGLSSSRGPPPGMQAIAQPRSGLKDHKCLQVMLS